MKKPCLFLSALILLSCFALISAYDVAYVVKYPDNLNSDEIAVRDTLTDNGFTVHILDDVKFNTDLYNAIVVSKRINDISKIFDNSYHKTFFMSSIAAKNQGFSSTSGSTIGRKVTILNNDHSVTDNFPIGELSIYPTNKEINYLSGCKAINSQSLISKSADGKDILYLLDKNALLLDGSCTKRTKKIYERNLFFGLTEASGWNLNSEKLFINAFNWLIDADDSDGDGYTGIEDCNDNDETIHPGAEELIDSIDQNCINDAPVLTKEIRAIILKENQNQKNIIDLNEYFKDPDGDSLTFSVHSISNEVDIKASIENSLVSFQTGELNTHEKIIFKANDKKTDTLSNEVILSSEDLGTCSNLNGFTCSVNQVCNGDWLDLAGTCCSVACIFEEAPEFKNIYRSLDKLSGDIKVNIRKPANNEEFPPGRDIETRIEIENKIKEDLEFDVEVYLYDLNDEEIIESFDTTIDLDENERKTIDNNIMVTGDIDTSHNYAILIAVTDENQEYYNEDYVRFIFKRNEHDVIIEKLEISPEEATCSGYITIKARAYNIGENDENVYVRLKNTELGIDEKSDEFLLERYNNDDTEIIEFRVKLPENLENKEYLLKAATYFSDKTNSLDTLLIIKGCKEQETEDEVISISGNENISSISPVKVKNNSLKWQIGLLISSLTVLLGLLIALIAYKRQNKQLLNF